MLFTQELKPKNIISRLISLTPHNIFSIISWKKRLPVSSNPVNASSFMTRANCTWRDSAAWGRARRWSSPLRSRPRGWSQSGSPDPAEQRVWAARGDPRVRRSDVQRLTGKSGPVQSQDVFEICSLTLSLIDAELTSLRYNSHQQSELMQFGDLRKQVMLDLYGTLPFLL